MWCLQFEGIFFKKAPKRLQLTLCARWGMRNETDETRCTDLTNPPAAPPSHEPQEDRRANQLPVA